MSLKPNRARNYFFLQKQNSKITKIYNSPKNILYIEHGMNTERKKEKNVSDNHNSLEFAM